jgi:hypothetical protein
LASGGSRRLAPTRTFNDLRDHNPNRPPASSQLHELEDRRPAVPLHRWRPLVPADARARPMRHGPSADRANHRELGKHRRTVCCQATAQLNEPDRRPLLTVDDRGGLLLGARWGHGR